MTRINVSSRNLTMQIDSTRVFHRLLPAIDPLLSTAAMEQADR